MLSRRNTCVDCSALTRSTDDVMEDRQCASGQYRNHFAARYTRDSVARAYGHAFRRNSGGYTTRSWLRKQSANLADLERRAAAHVPRGFAAALRRRATDQPAIIAELKKASPSKGLIRAEFNVTSLATSLAHAGAAALSVLTEPHFFQGSLANLQQASSVVTIPCLRKDFIVDEFQILEARAFAADAILLIAAGLDDSALKRLTDRGSCAPVGCIVRSPQCRGAGACPRSWLRCDRRQQSQSAYI